MTTSAGLVHLVMHTSSLSPQDEITFRRYARVLMDEYNQLYPEHERRQIFVRTGQDIVGHINRCKRGSIASWDLFSHGNYGGVHIARKLKTAKKVDGFGAALHFQIRQNSDKPQTQQDAQYAEESMHGLYTNSDAAQGASLYYNQIPSSGIAYLSHLMFDRFAEGCSIELHGCNLAQKKNPLEELCKAMGIVLPNFATKAASLLPRGGRLIAHSTKSAPRSLGAGYQHGTVIVYTKVDASGTVRQRTMPRADLQALLFPTPRQTTS